MPPHILDDWQIASPEIFNYEEKNDLKKYYNKNNNSPPFEINGMILFDQYVCAEIMKKSRQKKSSKKTCIIVVTGVLHSSIARAFLQKNGFIVTQEVWSNKTSDHFRDTLKDL